MESRKPDVVIYHANCPDGFTAAWTFWTQWGDTIDYIPCRHGQPPPPVEGKRVAIVDFSFKRDILTKMASEATSVVILDHHRSAQMDLDGLVLDNVYITFDMERSGAQIAWDYLNDDNTRPWFVEYVADRDLWRHQLPDTKEISQALFFDGYFTDFTKLESLVGADMSPFAVRGSVLLEVKQRDCEHYARAAKPAVFTVDGKEYRVGLVCCPRMYRSDVGNLVAQDYDFAALYWYNFASKEWWISFRASAESKCNLAEITSKLPNGGGHPKAAGFTIYSAKGENLETYYRAEDV